MLVSLGAGAAALLLAGARPAKEAAVHSPAPAFTLEDARGASHALADYQGKYVVLEWVNFGCPFVGKHYGSGNMQALQQLVTGRGGVWLSICSSAPGREGYYEGEALLKKINEEHAVPTAYLVDREGTVGMTYGAKATPTIAIIDPKGILIYEGGIDNIASTDQADIPKATNYVKEVMNAVWDGKPVPVSTTRSYGCSIKYP
ncbi:MAG TPA: redoxin domain-containing protein [Bacteroidota bacterium]|nr:redoxin domain-containing protein [Bacteroidota bacterium]